MEKDDGFKLRLSRMFHSSFGYCRSRNISDVVEKAVLISSHHLPPPVPPPKPRPFPYICPDPTRTVNNSCIVSTRDVARRSGYRVRQKVTEQPPLFSDHSRFWPPSSPMSTNPFYDKTEKMKKRSAVKKKKTERKNRRRPKLSSPSQDATTTPYDYYAGGDWFSSDDEREDDEEVETLFSSRSTFSSDDSSPIRRNNRRRRRSHRRNSTSRRRSTKKGDVLPLNDWKYEMKDSFAVVKRSSDPNSDFRTSMVEIIVERQIFGRAELEKLLQCFLALNSVHHHATIVEVFREIRETLFSDLY